MHHRRVGYIIVAQGRLHKIARRIAVESEIILSCEDGNLGRLLAVDRHVPSGA